MSEIKDHVTSKVDKTMRLVPIPVKPPLRLLSEGCALFLEDAGWDFHENSNLHSPYQIIKLSIIINNLIVTRNESCSLFFVRSELVDLP